MEAKQLLCLILFSLVWTKHCLGQSCSTPQDQILADFSKACDKLKSLNGPTPHDCSEWCQKGFRVSGVYEIDPDGLGKFKTFCDMTTDGGGWTVFQKRIDGSEKFYRSWSDYKKGFGDVGKEFWLGNDHLNRMTAERAYVLRVDMEDFNGTKKYAAYDAFSISNEAQKYKLSIGTYSGTAGNSMSRHHCCNAGNQPFSTKDRDNDGYYRNCAKLYTGAWWYSNCHNSNLNGQYLKGSQTKNMFAKGITWLSFRGQYYSLKHTEMKIRPKDFQGCEQ